MLRDPEYDRVRDFVARADPLLLEALEDVDFTLLEWGLSLSPWERLRASSEALRFWSSFRRVAPEAS